jgi:hypothetical protein
MGTQVSASLKHGGVVLVVPDPAVSPDTVPVDAAGLTIALDVPAGVDFASAQLSFQAPDDGVTMNVVAGPPAAVVTSDVTTQTGLPTTAAKWIAADWSVRRPLLLINVATAATGVSGRLVVSEGGPWFRPSPVEIVALGSSQRLAGFFATRMMVEMVSSTNTAGPTVGAVVSALTVTASARPVDLSAGIDPEAPFFHHGLPFLGGELVTLRDDLAAALRRAWPPDLKGGAVTVTLRSSAAGKILRPTLSLTSSAILQTFQGGAATANLSVPSDGELEAEIPLSTTKPLQAVRFTLARTLRAERLSLAPRPPAALPIAHRCGSGYDAAQSFAALPAGALLAGIDLYLRLTSPSITGTVALHADRFGRPADVPIDGTTLKIERAETGEPPWPYRWVALDFPRPVSPGTGAWWVVLTLAAGDTVWPLGDAAAISPAPEIAPRFTAYRRGIGPFRLREVPPEIASWTAPWAFTRVRLRDPAPPEPTVTLRWGTGSVAVPLDAGGHASLGAAALTALTPPAAPTPPLRVAVSSAAAAEITLSDLWVALSPENATLTGFAP